MTQQVRLLTLLKILNLPEVTERRQSIRINPKELQDKTTENDPKERQN